MRVGLFAVCAQSHVALATLASGSPRRGAWHLTSKSLREMLSVTFVVCYDERLSSSPSGKGNIIAFVASCDERMVQSLRQRP